VIYAAEPFGFNRALMWGVFAVIAVQVVITALGIPRRWPGLSGFNARETAPVNSSSYFRSRRRKPSIALAKITL